MNLEYELLGFENIVGYRMQNTIKLNKKSSAMFEYLYELVSPVIFSNNCYLISYVKYN